MAIASRIFSCDGPIYQVGVRGDDEDGDLGVLFAGHELVRVGSRPGPNIDRIEDAANLSVDDDTAGMVLALESLESTFEVTQAMDEAFRILKPGGLFLAATLLEVDGVRPSDYWRLTTNCLTRLMTPYKAWLVGWHGPEDRPTTAYVIGCKAPMPQRFATDCEQFIWTFNEWSHAEEQVQPWGQRMRRVWRRWLSGERRQAEHSHAQFALHLPDRESWARHWLDPVFKPSISS